MIFIKGQIIVYDCHCSETEVKANKFIQLVLIKGAEFRGEMPND